MLVAVHPAGDLACVEVEPMPWGAQWGLGDVMGRGPGAVGPAEGVGDQEAGHNLEEVDLGAGGPSEAGQTDQGIEQGEEAYRLDLEDQIGEVGGPDQEVEVLVDQEDQVGQVGDVEDPAFHLCHASSRSCPPAGRD